MKIVFVLLGLTVGGCAGYKPVPSELTVGFPYFMGGPSMKWKFEKVDKE